jgi:hypothetical protein
LTLLPRNTALSHWPVSDREFLDLSGNGQPEHLEVDFVSPGMFKVSGLPTVLGRVFTEQEDIPNGPLLAVLSEHVWRTRFQSDPKIIGKNLTLSDHSFQVLYIGRHVHRGDQPQIINVLFRPGQKLAAGSSVGFAGVGVPDPSREKLKELGRGILAGVSENRRNDEGMADG